MKLSINNDRVRNKKVKAREDRERGGREEDPRFLPYYKLEKGEELVIRLLPVSEDLPEESISWFSHGPNLRGGDLDPVQCIWRVSKGKCPICEKMFKLAEDGDEEGAERLKVKGYTLAQVIVLDAPKGFEIPETEDGNPVKLIWLPFAIKDLIEEEIIDGDVDINTADIVIKKRIKNKRADYSRSFIEPDSGELPQDLQDMFESGEAHLHEIDEFIHPVPSKVEAKKWASEAMKIITEDGDKDEEEEEEDEKPRRSSSKSSGSRRGSRRDKDDDEKEESEEQEDEEEEEEEEKPSRSSSSRRSRRSVEDDDDKDEEEEEEDDKKENIRDKYRRSRNRS